MIISVVICCYNSGSRIGATLEHIAKQEFEADLLEVVLVDNNCSDDTVSVANETWRRLKWPFELKVVKESQAGLSYARKAGVTHATGDIVVFCDDDNWLCADYAKICYQHFRSHQNTGALSGASIAVGESDFPIWFSTYQKMYAVGVVALDSGDVSSHGWVWGAGMAVRRDVLLALWDAGFKHQTTDRKGNQLSTGGDVEICKWLLLCGYRLHYDERMTLQHFISKERLTKTYLMKLRDENSRILGLLQAYDCMLHVRMTPVFMLKYFAMLPLVMLRLLREELTVRDRYVLTRCLRFLHLPRKRTVFDNTLDSIRRFGSCYKTSVQTNALQA